MKKKYVLFYLLILASTGMISWTKTPGITWDESYTFDKCNYFQIEFYASGNELMRTVNYATSYQSDGDNFVVRTLTEGEGTGMETVIDKKNEVAIQIFGTGGGAVPNYNAGGYRYPEAAELKKLELIATEETKQILGYPCKKYTYTYKKIFGEVWLTDQIELPNDIGVFRACKMAALHNTLSVPGFVMEMTTEDARGGKTLMKTISLLKDEKYVVDFKGVEMNTALNKVNYFVF
jgi:GLPGLI family protein